MKHAIICPKPEDVNPIFPPADSGWRATEGTPSASQSVCDGRHDPSHALWYMELFVPRPKMSSLPGDQDTEEMAVR